MGTLPASLACPGPLPTITQHLRTLLPCFRPFQGTKPQQSQENCPQSTDGETKALGEEMA